MKSSAIILLAAACLGLASMITCAAIACAAPALKVSGDAPADQSANQAGDSPALSVAGARAQAKLLHETIHSTLQIVHHQYYREDEGLAIPAFTLKSIFKEVGDRTGVKLHWLVVNAEAMNVGHKPRDEFETKAAQALSDGKQSYESSADGLYRHVGVITLGNDCLKCHLSSRTSTADRLAGLVISIPTEND